MDYYGDPAVAGMLGRPERGPPPRRGEEKEFDQYCDRLMDGLDAEETDFAEMRKAAWATWKVGPPSRNGDPARAIRDQEDEELARAMAMSAREHSDRYPEHQVDGLASFEGADDDEELRRAIAMSEEEARAPKRHKREHTPEEERKMLAEAMKASMAEAASRPDTPEAARSIVIPAVSAPVVQAAAELKPPSVLGNRAQMEAERIARQKAREVQNASSSQPSSSVLPPAAKAPSSSSGSKVATMSDLRTRNAEAGPSSSSRSNDNSGNASKAFKPTHHPLQSRGPFPTDAAGEYYLDGEMRHVALTIGNPSDAPTFTPHQVVGKKTEIALLVMCSFCIDDEWLNTILPPPELVPTVLIRPHPKEKHAVFNGKVQVQPNGEVWSYPRMVGEFGSAHMKFFWIFYKTGRLRVVISTANMVDYDWDWIENSVFIQDFLPSAPLTTPSSPMGDDFLERFRDLLIHMKVHKAVKHLKDAHPFGKRIPLDPSEALQDLSMYDFSKVRVKLVMSVPGKYTGFDQINDFGLARLGHLLKTSDWLPAPGERVLGEYQGSSLGNYSLEWLDTFYRFMTGQEAKDRIGKPKAREWPPIKVLFPSLATVENSALGKEGGGTMFVGSGWKGVTKHLFHDANSKRGGVLMHSKVLIALFEKQNHPLGFADSQESNGRKRKASELNDAKIGGWAYMGSHNFTPAAWGNIRLNDKPPTMSISNYELGIVFPLPRDHAAAAADAIAPFNRPARPYSPTDVPWDQKLKGDGKLTMHTPK